MWHCCDSRHLQGPLSRQQLAQKYWIHLWSKARLYLWLPGMLSKYRQGIQIERRVQLGVWLKLAKMRTERKRKRSIGITIYLVVLNQFVQNVIDVIISISPNAYMWQSNFQMRKWLHHCAHLSLCLIYSASYHAKQLVNVLYLLSYLQPITSNDLYYYHYEVCDNVTGNAVIFFTTAIS